MNLKNSSYCFVFVILISGLIYFTDIKKSFGDDETTNYADWMAQYKNQIEDLPINKLTLLGSHDAASIDIKEGSDPATGYLTHNNKHIKRKAKESDVPSARCQSATISEQLLAGVRYFDLRIAYQDGEYWGMHEWLSTPAFGDGGVFMQVKSFLETHPNEIIIFYSQHLYWEKGLMTQGEALLFYHKVENYFGDLMIKKANFSTLTYGDIWKGKGRIILVAAKEFGSPEHHKTKHHHKRSTYTVDDYDSDSNSGSSQESINDDPYLWNGNDNDSKWMDTGDTDTLISGLDDIVSAWKNGNSNDKLRHLQCMTTTQNKIEDAKATNALIREKLKTDWKDAPISIVQVDDSVNSGLMPILLSRISGNKKN